MTRPATVILVPPPCGSAALWNHVLPVLDELGVPSVAVELHMVKLKNMRAGKYHGEATSRDCPVSGRAPLTQVSFAYGDELRDASGATRLTAELVTMEARYHEFAVHVVEFCRICGWNHLDTSYVLGSAASAAARGKRAIAAQQAGLA